jgi:hypothetical protein
MKIWIMGDEWIQYFLECYPLPEILPDELKMIIIDYAFDTLNEPWWL